VVGGLGKVTGANRSVILCEVFAEAVTPEAGIAGLNPQEQLCGSQLIVKVKGCRSVRIANPLQISIDLLFSLQTTKIKLNADRAYAQSKITTLYTPPLSDKPWKELVAEKQNREGNELKSAGQDKPSR
jgi:hypothetical protein